MIVYNSSLFYQIDSKVDTTGMLLPKLTRLVLQLVYCQMQLQALI